MKALVRLVAAIALTIAVIVFAPAGGPGGPAPIAHGRDSCDSCRMRLDRPGFAAELEVAGRFLKFDDIGCLAHTPGATSPGARVWLEDHRTGELVPLREATLVRSSDVRTPMGSGVVAFRDRASAGEHLRRTRGEFVTFEGLTTARAEAKS